MHQWLIIFLIKTLYRGGQHKLPAAVNSNTHGRQHNARDAVNLTRPLR
jgi:hypothetical protein